MLEHKINISTERAKSFGLPFMGTKGSHVAIVLKSVEENENYIFVKVENLPDKKTTTITYEKNNLTEDQNIFIL